MRCKITPAMIFTKKEGVVCPILPYLRKVRNYPTYRIPNELREVRIMVFRAQIFKKKCSAINFISCSGQNAQFQSHAQIEMLR